MGLEILNPAVQQYLRDLLPPRDNLLARLEQYARANVVPIVEPEIAQLLYWLALSQQSTRVLEIGTAIGYSTLWLAKAVLPRGGKITTIEINEPRYREARKNFQEAGVSRDIQLILGDARSILFELTGPYDFIFLDAAKGKYPQFLDKCLELLVPGGILVAEDVLMGGMVITGEVDKRRNKTAVARLRRYLETVMADSRLVTTILPLGDGLALSIKK